LDIEGKKAETSKASQDGYQWQRKELDQGIDNMEIKEKTEVEAWVNRMDCWRYSKVRLGASKDWDDGLR